MGSQRVGHDWATDTFTSSFILYIILCTCSSQTPIHPSPISLPSGNQKSVLYICESVSVLRQVPLLHVLDSTYTGCIGYLSFSFWLASFSRIISNCIPAAANGLISPFLWLSGTPFIHVPHLYSFICQWAFSRFHVLTIVNSAAMNIGEMLSSEL